jgi:hypothetical protein
VPTSFHCLLFVWYYLMVPMMSISNHVIALVFGCTRDLEGQYRYPISGNQLLLRNQDIDCRRRLRQHLFSANLLSSCALPSLVRGALTNSPFSRDFFHKWGCPDPSNW